MEGTAGSAVDIYTVDTDSWRAGAYQDHGKKSEDSTYCLFAANDLPNQIWGAAVVPHGNSFFLVGGAKGDDPDYVWLADIYRYDQVHRINQLFLK